MASGWSFALVATGAAIPLLAPTLVPTLILLAAIFPVSGLALSSDVLVLGGILLGFAIDSARRQDARWAETLADRIWFPFLLLIGALLWSAAANWWTQVPAEGHKIVSDTKWFVFRLCTVAFVAVTVRQRSAIWSWLTPLVWIGAVLAVLRILQANDLHVTEWLSASLRLQVFGDLRYEGWYNGYGSLLALALCVAIAAALRTPGPPASYGYWPAAFLIVLGMYGVNSRTASVVIVAQVILFALISPVRPRAVLGLLGATFLAVTAGEHDFAARNSLFRRELVIAAGSNPTDLIGLAACTEMSPAVWRAPLVDSGHRLGQRLRVRSPDQHNLHLSVRRGSGARDVNLHVYVNGVSAAIVHRLPERQIEWITVPLPRSLVAEGWIDVEVAAEGKLDAARNYIEVAGLGVRSPQVQSRYVNGRWTWDTDLSSDPGTQRGVFLILLDERTIAGAEVLESDTDKLDQSVSDRIRLWRHAIAIAAMHPWSGTGYHTFGRVYARTFTKEPRFFLYANAHNAFLEAASDLGIPGPLALLAIFAALTATVVRDLVISRARDLLAAALGLALCSVLATSVTQTWFADVRYATPVWIVMGAIVASRTTRGTRVGEDTEQPYQVPADAGLPVGVRSD